MAAKIQRTDMPTLGRAWAVGMDLVIYVLAGGILGFGLDFLFKTKPWLMIVFAILGLASGMLRFIREAMVLNREVTRKAQQQRDDRAG